MSITIWSRVVKKSCSKDLDWSCENWRSRKKKQFLDVTISRGVLKNFTKINIYRCRKCKREYHIKLSIKRSFVTIPALVFIGSFFLNFYDFPAWLIGLLAAFGLIFCYKVNY